jgi:Tfp pilus assembly protein PilX
MTNTIYHKKIKLVLCVFVIGLISHANAQSTTITYATPGSTVWTVPVCVTSVTVQAWGGGGGGGSAWSRCSNGGGNEACAGAGGGGGGGYTSKVFAVTPGDNITITVGAGGAGGTVGTGVGSGVNGFNGGNSSFIGPSINLTATGGTGGTLSQANNTQCAGCGNTRIGSAGGAGGSGNGTTVYNGGTGSVGAPGGSFDFSGSGGGGAGTTAAGSNGNLSVAGNPPVGGAGGATGGGKGGDGRKTAVNSNQTGAAGTALGGGGGGGLTHRTDYIATAYIAAGGAGERGEVRVTYVAATPPVVSISIPICNTNSTTVNLVATASSTVSPTYVWSNTGGNINNGGSTLSPNVNSPGSYTLIAYNGAITCSASANVVLTTTGCNLLAIELASITAERNDNTVNVNWGTYSETDNILFEIQRSFDGINFESIKKIKGSGNSSQKLNYTIIDENPSKGSNYYRLKSIDKNEKATFSKIVSVDPIKTENTIGTIYPNPTHSELTFDYFSLTNDIMEIEITDYLGRIILKEERKINEGSSNHNIYISELENGIYSIKIKLCQNNYLVNKKIIKN